MKSKTPSARQQALFQQARVLHHSGRLTEAAILFQKLLKDFPKDPQLLGELGTIAIELGNFERGAILLEKSLQVYPNEPDVLFNRGLALAKLQRLEAALASFDQAIKLKPLYAQAHYNRADILKNLNRLDGAIESYERAIALRPDYSEAYNDLGLAHWELQQFPQALVCYERAIALKPDYFYAYYNLGNALQYLRRFEEALDCYDNMIALAPDEPGAYFNRGQVLNELKRYAAALNCYDRSLAIKPDYAYLHGQRLFTKLQICDWSNMKKESAELAAKIEAEKKVTTPLTVLACFGQLALHRKAAEIWTADKYPTNPALPKISKYAKHGKIRIGYFSADFRCHAVAFLTAELYEKHDRGRFEVIAFSLGPDTKDDMRLRLESGFDRFIDVQILSDYDIVQFARNLELDIAIDLNGHTGESRPGIFALRAAPLQLSYIGYLGTMGAEYMDYLIADPIIIPENAKPNYTEKIIYLPSYQVNDTKRIIADVFFPRSHFGLPETGFVFCCFNNNYKITPEVFSCWMRILISVDESVLFLLAENEFAEQNLMNAAVLNGVDKNRLVFGKTLPLPEYLARYRLADLFLDTLPYNAGTTASDALWVGLPVLTCLGETFAGRVAASLLTSIGLPELIASTQEQYESMAIELARNPNKLAGIKSRLAQNRLTTALFDVQRFTDHIEEAYTQIYERYQADLPPEDIYIPPLPN